MVWVGPVLPRPGVPRFDWRLTTVVSIALGLLALDAANVDCGGFRFGDRMAVTRCLLANN